MWANTCLANYNALLAYALACCEEWEYRHAIVLDKIECREHEYQDVIAWCSENKPDLPRLEVVRPGEDINGNLFPLVMRQKYIVLDGELSPKKPDDYAFIASHIHIKPNITESYRNYYRARLRKMARKKCILEMCSNGKVLIDTSSCSRKCELSDNICEHAQDCYHCNGKGYITQEPTWKRRERPEFLGDL
jgi:hypothetical protein